MEKILFAIRAVEIMIQSSVLKCWAGRDMIRFPPLFKVLFSFHMGYIRTGQKQMGEGVS